MPQTLYVNRDISWLSFNYRVLQEAKDPGVPLFERIKFLAIYSNNLDEFFKVRVAHQRNLIRLGKKTKKKLKITPTEILKQIISTVNKQQEEFSRIFEKEIIPELQRYNIFMLRRQDLNNYQQEFVEKYFRNHLLPFVQPVLLVKNKIRPFLNNAALYLVIELKDKSIKEKSKSEYALLKIPSDHTPRFITLPSKDGSQYVIMLDDIVRHSVSWLFPGYDIEDTYSVKLTRDAELYIDDEFSGDLIGKIKSSLALREVGPPSRFVYDRSMPSKVLDFLQKNLGLHDADLLKEGRYHNNFDFFQFPNFDISALHDISLPPIHKKTLENETSICKAIEKQDELLFFPYHKYEYVVRFFEEAKDDPTVTHIFITLYRTAKKSRIMDALIKAAKAGKQVTVFVEVKARFDEQANLRWGEKLEKVGVHVLYSFPGLKVHCKLALIIRSEDENKKSQAFLGTGNFHEKTAKLYTDFGLLTSDPKLTKEVARIFHFLKTVRIPQEGFSELLVGQFNLRSNITKLIYQEIRNVKRGKKGHIIIKMNSLEDEQVMKRLIEASQAGVKVQMIIRGICCLIPHIKGFSEKIEIISIVDRFLEHPRVLWFHNDGKEKLYLSSADLMTRNLSYRIEVAFPVHNEDIKKEIKHFLDLQLKDNRKARIIDGKHKNKYKQGSSDISIRSQEEIYYYIKRKEEINVEE